MIPYSFHPEADAEFADAALFYESRVAGLGRQLSVEVQRIISLIREHPDAGAPVHLPVRRTAGRSVSVRHGLPTGSRVGSHACCCASAPTPGLLAEPAVALQSVAQHPCATDFIMLITHWLLNADHEVAPIFRLPTHVSRRYLSTGSGPQTTTTRVAITNSSLSNGRRRTLRGCRAPPAKP